MISSLRVDILKKEQLTTDFDKRAQHKKIDE